MGHACRGMCHHSQWGTPTYSGQWCPGSRWHQDMLTMSWCEWQNSKASLKNVLWCSSSSGSLWSFKKGWAVFSPSAVESLPPEYLFSWHPQGLHNPGHAMNPNQQLYVVSCACTNPQSDEPCHFKPRLKTSQNLFLIFPGCCRSPGSGERQHRGRGGFSVQTAVAVFGDDIQIRKRNKHPGGSDRFWCTYSRGWKPSWWGGES